MVLLSKLYIAMQKIIIDTTFGTPKHQVFTEVFKNIAEVTIFENNKKVATPLCQDAFFPAVEGRIAQIEQYWKAKESNENALFGTIQRGFIKTSSLWQFTAIVGIQKEGKFYACFTESIHVAKITDELMEKQESARCVEMELLYPGLKTHGLLAILNRSQTEVQWLKIALQNCKYALGL
jgi:hypothetical protein